MLRRGELQGARDIHQRRLKRINLYRLVERNPRIHPGTMHFGLAAKKWGRAGADSRQSSYSLA
jgi:hypothetical protein